MAGGQDGGGQAEMLPALADVLEREWLVTDGRGGYASGTIAGPNTRRYHGLLVAPPKPSQGRTVLLAKLEESLAVGGVDGPPIAFSASEFRDGVIHPDGYRHLKEFRLEGGVPTWRFRAGPTGLEKRVWMASGHSTTYVRYTLIGETPARLDLVPLCTYRTFHAETVGSEDWRLDVERHDLGLSVRAFDGAVPYHLLPVAPPGRTWRYTANGTWWWGFLHRVERDRGLDCLEDLYAPGTLSCDLFPGESLMLVATVEAPEKIAGDLPPAPAISGWEHGGPSPSPVVLSAEGATPPASPGPAHDVHPAPGPGKGVGDETFGARLRQAAGQFFVARQLPGDPVRNAIVAGYHWFGATGRGTTIAIPGLALATGRFGEVEAILRQLADSVDRGMLPNRFPASGAPAQEEDYNSADATLWYFRAVDFVDRHTQSGLVEAVLPVLGEILDWHIWGTRHGIHVDPQDGLLRVDSGRLTWMDAKVGEWVVTPRAGKPVEIAALWHHALWLMEGWCRRVGRGPQARYYCELRKRAGASIAERFWYQRGGYLFDVVDGPRGDDASVRPNQIIAAALPDFPLSDARRRAVVDVVKARLWTPRGVRTLDRDDPRYQGMSRGDVACRDGAAHQGAAWTWLLGSLVDAHLLAYGDPAASRELLRPLQTHLDAEAGYGSISEVFDGDPPHTAGGCIAQAWSVGEVFRAWEATAGRS